MKSKVRRNISKSIELPKIEKREIDLSSYIEYKNQEYILAIKDLKFEVSNTPDIDVKVMNKSDASPPG